MSFWASRLSTRLNDKQRGVIIVVMQRLHQEDLAGYLTARGGWDHLNLPAIAIEDESVAIGGGNYHQRKEGEALHPEREPLATLERIKTEVGSLQFSAQYQQSPVPREGNIVRREWFKYYEMPPMKGEGVRTIQSWDIATTTSERNNYSVCTTWAVTGKDYYLLHVWRGRLEFPDLKRKIVSHTLDHGANAVIIEKAGPGLQLIQDLRRDSTPGFPHPIGIKPEGDKLMRLETQTPQIEAGHVLLPKEAPWLADFLEELLAFPNGKFDDQVDSVSQFLKWAWNDARPSTVSYFGPEVIELEEEPW